MLLLLPLLLQIKVEEPVPSSNFLACYVLSSKRDKDRVGAFGDSDSEIRVLTVKDGEGRELREAKFVEILKEARHRIRSATVRGKKGVFSKLCDVMCGSVGCTLLTKLR